MGYIGTSGKLEQLVFSEICILRILIFFFLHTFISLRETYFTKTMYIRGDQRWRLGEEILLLFIITFHSVEKWSRKRVLTD